MPIAIPLSDFIIQNSEFSSLSEHKRKASFPTRRAPDGKEEPGGLRPLRWKGSVRYIMLAITAVVIALLFPRSSTLEYEYELGSIWSGDTIRAPFAFPLYKDDASYDRDVKRAVADV